MTLANGFRTSYTGVILFHAPEFYSRHYRGAVCSSGVEIVVVFLKDRATTFFLALQILLSELRVLNRNRVTR
tara:strand:+ start:2372 stop:2587 length:216 start_codon:yes stop_codon:yes gene_type:complete